MHLESFQTDSRAASASAELTGSLAAGIRPFESHGRWRSNGRWLFNGNTQERIRAGYSLAAVSRVKPGTD